MKFYYVLNSQNRAHVTRSIAEDIRKTPDGYVLRLTEPNRSLSQNAHLHGLLTEVGNMIGWKWNQSDVDLRDLKSIFTAAYRKFKGIETRMIEGIDGQPVNLDWHTSDFTKAECAEFTEMTYAWMSEYRRNNGLFERNIVDKYRALCDTDSSGSCLDTQSTTST